MCGLAERLFADDRSVDWAGLAADYDAIRDRIEAVVPGFDDFNRRIDQPGGFVLPHPPRDDRRFTTPSGRAQLTVNVFDPTVVPPGRLLLQTVRSHDQYNTTVYGLDDRYRGIRGGAGWSSCTRRTWWCWASRTAIRSTWSASGTTATDGPRAFASWRTPCPEEPARRTSPRRTCWCPWNSVADESGTPTSKAVVVRLEARDQTVGDPVGSDDHPKR